MSISDLILKARPNLSPSSVKTYTSILSSLHRKCFGGEMDLADFKDSKRVIEFLHTKPAAARKTVLSALVVLTSLDAYKTAMCADIQTFNTDMAKQEASPAQKAAEISPADIKAIYDRLAAEAAVLYKKPHKTVSDLLAINDMVILALLSGIYIPPRRALDYCAFKIRDVNKESDNYLDKNELVFQKYKTAKTYGKQTVAIPAALKSILTKYIKLNPTEWLLFDSKMTPLTSVKMNQRLHKIFGGRRVAINALRHSYLTSKYTDLSKEQKLMNEDMHAMGSSPAVLNSYVKLS